MPPGKLYLETTTRCNLQCGMCIKQAPGNTIGDRDFDPGLFPRLRSTFTSLNGLVLNGIGEPLLYPHLDDIITQAAALMPAESWIGFQSNGMLLTEQRAQQLFGAGLSRLCISVDSGGKDPSCGQSLLHPRQPHLPLAIASSVRARHGHTGVQLGAEIVLLDETLARLPELVADLADQGVDFILASHLLAHRPEMEAQSLFCSCTPEALQLVTKWQAQAAGEGLNLSDFTAATWIAPRRDEEHRLLALYRGMLADAREKDIWLDPQQVTAVDRTRQNQAEHLFLHAQETADRLGVKLSLPPLYASRARSCRFMEDGAIFVDAAGEVMPCHPLWHQHTVYHNGKAKHIHKQRLGSLRDQDLTAIWASPACRTFRTSARRYDTPFCHSCSVGPCADIDGMSEPFIDDCFATGVPCGHCLWCFDAVRCL